MSERSGRDQPIRCANLTACLGSLCGKPPPEPRRLAIDPEYPLPVIPVKPVQPLGKPALPRARIEKPDPPLDLAKGDSTDEDISLGQCLDCQTNTRSALRMNQFGQDAGIEQHPHRETSRMGEVSRPRSTPSRDGPDAR